MTRRSRSLTSTSIPNLRDIAVDSSIVMLAFINSEAHTVNSTQSDRIKFGETLNRVFKDDTIPTPLLKLISYLSTEGVTVPDIFRRPGNSAEQQKLIKRLSDGKQINLLDYNFYTLSSVIKKFLLSIPGGILGRELEKQALAVLYLEDRVQQIKSLSSIIRTLPITTQRFLALLFGMWHRIATRGCQQKMTAEAMAKSVTGSIFQNLSCDPKLVKNAALVMEILIQSFASSILFGEDHLKFFTSIVKCSIKPSNEESNSEEINPAHRGSTGNVMTVHSASNTPPSSQRKHRYDDIKTRQLDRLKQRREWFLSGSRSTETTAGYKAPRSYLSRQTIADIPCHNKTKSCCINTSRDGDSSDSDNHQSDSDGN